VARCTCQKFVFGVELRAAARAATRAPSSRAFGRHGAHVFVGGLPVDDGVPSWHELDGVADGGLQVAQARRRRRRPGPAAGAARRGWRRATVGASGAPAAARRSAAPAAARPFAASRAKVVTGLRRQSAAAASNALQRVLVVGRHEDEEGQGAGVVRPVLGDGLGGFQARHAGHADVEEAELGAVPQGQLDGGRAAGRPGRRPAGHGQAAASSCAQVLGQAGARLRRSGRWAVMSGISMRATLPPPG